MTVVKPAALVFVELLDANRSADGCRRTPASRSCLRTDRMSVASTIRPGVMFIVSGLPALPMPTIRPSRMPMSRLDDAQDRDR